MNVIVTDGPKTDWAIHASASEYAHILAVFLSHIADVCEVDHKALTFAALHSTPEALCNFGELNGQRAHTLKLFSALIMAWREARDRHGLTPDDIAEFKTRVANEPGAAVPTRSGLTTDLVPTKAQPEAKLMAKTLAEYWEEFSQHIAGTPSPNARHETRKIFYAGALAIVALLRQAVTNEAKEALMAELVEFCDEMEKESE